MEYSATMMMDNYGKRMAEIEEKYKQSMLEVKKKNAEEIDQYTVMVNDYGDKMSELEKKYRDSSLEVTKVTAELVRLRERLEHSNQHNRDLQEKLNEAKAPSNIYFCRYGEVYRGPSCNHTKDKQVNYLRKCKDCLP